MAEAVSILNLIYTIKQYQAELNSGGLVIFTNSKKIRNYILNKQHKASKFVRDADATLAVIKHKIEHSLIRIHIEYNKGKPSRRENFYNNLGVFLMREYNQRSKIIRENEWFNPSIINLKPLEHSQLLINKKIVD